MYKRQVLSHSLKTWSGVFKDKYWLPRSFDDRLTAEFNEAVLNGVHGQREDDDGHQAFPAEMQAEEIEEEENADGSPVSLDGVNDREDAEEFPFGDPSEAAQKEQEMLDEMPLPGFPIDEKERRAKWAQVPRKARAAIRRLHLMLGHRPKEVLVQILKGARAPQQYVDAVRYFRCDACATTAKAPKTHPVSAPSMYAFTHCLLYTSPSPRD